MWHKGHTPSINDRRIENAVETLSQLDTGIRIDIDEIPAIEGKIMQLIQNQINEEKRKQFADQMV